MTDLFIDPKVLNYSQDRYELVLLTLSLAKLAKAKGSPEPMQALIEKSLKDIVEGKITREQALQQLAESPETATPTVKSEEGIPSTEAMVAAFNKEEEEEEKSKGKKKAKK